jgi:hypothetical protein
MTHHLWPLLAFAALVLAAFGTGKLLGWFIDRPEPAHAKPSRRQREKARDEATVDTFRGFLAEQHMETMPQAPGPLMPLPPEVADDPCPECGCPPSQPLGCGCNNDDCPCSEPEDPAEVDDPRVEPADPLAVLGDDACADALVGPVRPRCRSGQGHDYDRCPGCDACRGCHPHDPGMGCLPYLAAVPVPRDDYADLAGGQYAEATGQFSVAVLDEYERAHAGGA